MQTGPVDHWTTLRDGVKGTLLRPEDPDFETARAKPYIAGDSEPVPTAVLRCGSTDDVVAAIAFARRHDLPLAVRSGGHCSAGLSSTTGLLVDTSLLDEVAVTGDRAVVGAGVRLAGLVPALAAHGRALPAGTCPTVGVTGLTLGGGWGLLGRMYGLTSDHLVEAEVVTADGRVIVTDEDREPDLFWALRGGGTGGLGVVTSLVFRTLPAPRMTNFQCRWPVTAAAEVIEAWLGWAIDVQDRMCASLGVSADEVKLHGAMAGTESETAAVLNRFCRELAPASTDLAELSYPDTARYHAERLGELDPSTHVYSASEFFEADLLPSVIGELLDGFGSGPPERELGLMPWSGAYAAVPVDATAFPHRRARYTVEHLALTPGPDTAARAWVTDLWAAAHPHGTGGVYANFADPDLDGWEHAYYGANLTRLREVKRHYDPDDVFHTAQSIRLS